MKGGEITIQENPQETLEAASPGKESLQSWIFERVKPFLSGRVLEVSHGNGSLTPYYLQNNKPVEVLPINLDDDLSILQHKNQYGAFDTLVVLELSERALNRQTVIANCAGLLKKEGFLIIPLPASTALYNGLDMGFRRWKLHNMEYIHSLVQNHFRIVKARYFIVAADHQQLLPHGMSKYRDRVAIFSKSNASSFNGSGLHAIVVARKK